MHIPEWLWCCVASLRSGWRWICWRWECRWWYCLQLLSIQWMLPIVVFWVVSTVQDLVSLIRGSFSKPCPPDLGNALDDPNSSILTHGWAPVLFHRHVESRRFMFLLLFLLLAVWWWFSRQWHAYCPHPGVLQWVAYVIVLCWSRPLQIWQVVSLLSLHHVLSVGLGKALWCPSLQVS